MKRYVSNDDFQLKDDFLLLFCFARMLYIPYVSMFNLNNSSAEKIFDYCKEIQEEKEVARGKTTPTTP